MLTTQCVVALTKPQVALSKVYPGKMTTCPAGNVTCFQGPLACWTCIMYSTSTHATFKMLSPVVSYAYRMIDDLQTLMHTAFLLYLETLYAVSKNTCQESPIYMCFTVC